MAKKDKDKKKGDAKTSAAVQEPPETQGTPEGPTDGAEPTSSFPLIPVGMIVWYWEREMIVRADQKGKMAQPCAAIVTAIDAEGEDVSLMVFHPHYGSVEKHHVRHSESVEANHFSLPPTVFRVQDMKNLILAAEEHMKTAPAPGTTETATGEGQIAET